MIALYRVLARTFIGGSLRERGEIVEFDGDAGRNLVPAEDTDWHKRDVWKPQIPARPHFLGS